MLAEADRGLPDPVAGPDSTEAKAERTQSIASMQLGQILSNGMALTRLLELQDALLVGVLVGAPELAGHQIGHVLQDGHVGRRQLQGLAMQQAPVNTVSLSRLTCYQSSFNVRYTSVV